MCTILNQEIHDRFTGSGLTRKAFADSEGISPSTLSYHLKRAGSGTGEPPVTFTELDLPSSPAHMEITTPSGIVVRIPL